MSSNSIILLGSLKASEPKDEEEGVEEGREEEEEKKEKGREEEEEEEGREKEEEEEEEEKVGVAPFWSSPTVAVDLSPFLSQFFFNSVVLRVGDLDFDLDCGPDSVPHCPYLFHPQEYTSCVSAATATVCHTPHATMHTPTV